MTVLVERMCWVYGREYWGGAAFVLAVQSGLVSRHNGADGSPKNATRAEKAASEE